MKCPICNSELIYIDSFSERGVMFSRKTKIGEIYKCPNTVVDFITREPRCRSVKSDNYITVLRGQTFLGKPNWLT